jgi:hypothetical protein
MNKVKTYLIISAMLLTIVAASFSVSSEEIVLVTPSQKIILATGKIAGTITDLDGNPVENAHVAAFNILGVIGGESAIAFASTATDGTYEMNVPDARYTVVAGKFGYGGAIATPVLVEAGKITVVDLSLSGSIISGSVPVVENSEAYDMYIYYASSVAEPQSEPELTVGTGTIRGTITNQNGRPVAFVRIIAVRDPKENETPIAFTFTHLLIGGKGTYSMRVPSGRFLFLRAGKLPLYIGAWAGPVVVKDGGVTELDLSITYIGPKSVSASSQISSQTSNSASTL